MPVPRCSACSPHACNLSTSDHRLLLHHRLATRLLLRATRADLEDYFLRSRDVGWFAIGASLFVSKHLHRALHRLRRVRRDLGGWGSATSSGSLA